LIGDGRSALYAETIEVWHSERLVATMERQRSRNVTIDIGT
jgi:hypothetical protein